MEAASDGPPVVVRTEGPASRAEGHYVAELAHRRKPESSFEPGRERMFADFDTDGTLRVNYYW